MSKCTICGESRSPFIMNNKTVCMKCDELLFDIEIECEDGDLQKSDKKHTPHLPGKQPAPVIKK